MPFQNVLRFIEADDSLERSIELIANYLADNGGNPLLEKTAEELIRARVKLRVYAVESGLMPSLQEENLAVS
ncbi:MAG: hypothetical protein EOP06_23875 [Proteobacteria bacterium]|nr:MAG: hypothetical protein EOP06_23875 [Pseudomonadota bacterium]